MKPWRQAADRSKHELLRLRRRGHLQRWRNALMGCWAPSLTQNEATVEGLCQTHRTGHVQGMAEPNHASNGRRSRRAWTRSSVASVANADLIDQRTCDMWHTVCVGCCQGCTRRPSTPTKKRWARRAHRRPRRAPFCRYWVYSTRSVERLPDCWCGRTSAGRTLCSSPARRPSLPDYSRVSSPSSSRSSWSASTPPSTASSSASDIFVSSTSHLRFAFDRRQTASFITLIWRTVWVLKEPCCFVFLNACFVSVYTIILNHVSNVFWCFFSRIQAHCLVFRLIWYDTLRYDTVR